MTQSTNPIFIAGPCVIESAQLLDTVAAELVRLRQTLGVEIIFKASFDKANRTSLGSFRGPGMEQGLRMLADVKSKYGLRILTDIHETWQAGPTGEVVDVIQIPAFLCRQTDLLVAAAETGKAVNIKKGQFLSPEAMGFALQKVRDAGNDNVALTERGVTFGYQDLVVDYRGIPEMQKFGAPVILDVTHSLQQPNQAAGVTGGRPDLIDTIARAGVAVGVDGIFIETHQNPSVAKSDGANMLPLAQLPVLLARLSALRAVINNF